MDMSVTCPFFFFFKLLGLDHYCVLTLYFLSAFPLFFIDGHLIDIEINFAWGLFTSFLINFPPTFLPYFIQVWPHRLLL